MDAGEFIRQFQDHHAPKLDTYEQAIYLYIFRHSRLEGREDHVVGFKSAKKRMAFGVGTAGSPMADRTGYEKLKSLAQKGCIEILDSERFGQRIRLHLPNEIPGIIVRLTPSERPDPETLDFFNELDLRKAILVRESHQCFYCLRKLIDSNYVIEHVISRPEGDNSYRNVVALVELATTAKVKRLQRIFFANFTEKGC